MLSSSRVSAPIPWPEAVRVFARIGLHSFGGPAGQIAVMHRELVEKEKWIGESRYGRQAVFLVDADNSGNPLVPITELSNLRKAGLNIIAPAMPVLLTVDRDNQIAASAYAKEAKRLGLDIISWSAERSGRIVEDVLSADRKTATFYYSTIPSALSNDGDILTTVDALAKKVGVIGLFADWPATTSYYASCMGLK